MIEFKVGPVCRSVRAVDGFQPRGFPERRRGSFTERARGMPSCLEWSRGITDPEELSFSLGCPGSDRLRLFHYGVAHLGCACAPSLVEGLYFSFGEDRGPPLANECCRWGWSRTAARIVAYLVCAFRARSVSIDGVHMSYLLSTTFNTVLVLQTIIR